MAIDTTHDIVPDSPTNTFATFNPLANSTGTFSNGNLRIFHTSNTLIGLSTISYPLTGKYYSEFGDIALGDISYRLVVIYNNTTGKQVEFAMDGSWTNEAGTRTNGYLPSFSSTDVAGFWVDLENGEYAFSKNGSFGDTKQFASSFYANGISASSTDNVVFRFQGSGTIASWGITVNTGQDPTFGGATGLPTTPSGYPFTDANGIGKFYYQPPTGALALCTANLPTPNIDPKVDDLPEDYFKAKVYSGTGANQNIDIGFNPDFVWTKQRNGTEQHWVASTVLGTNYVASINPQTGTASGSGIGVNDFSPTSTSYQVSSQNGINISGTDNLVSWSWKAGGFSSDFNIDGKTYTSYANIQSENSSNFPASNVGGTPAILIPNKISVNTKSGFSCLTFTGTGVAAKIPHGLGSAPKFFISKRLDSYSTSHWDTWHVGLGATKAILLNTNYAEYVTDRFYDTAPDDLYYYVKTDGGVNGNGNTHVTFLWSEIAGYSAFGSYEGNNSATDGPFVYTGFKPAFVMLKNIDTTAKWAIVDSARSSYNPTRDTLYPDSSLAAYTGTLHDVDLLSNGFKLRTNDGIFNMSYTYIYAAFAEQPFKYANAR